MKKISLPSFIICHISMFLKVFKSTVKSTKINVESINIYEKEFTV